MGSVWSVIFHLALTAGLLWYQRKGQYLPAPWRLTALWYAVSVVLGLIEATNVTGTLFSVSSLLAFFVSLFYVPAVLLTFLVARRRRFALWKSLSLFVLTAAISTFLASVALANIPAAQGLSS